MEALLGLLLVAAIVGGIYYVKTKPKSVKYQEQKPWRKYQEPEPDESERDR